MVKENWIITWNNDILKTITSAVLKRPKAFRFSASIEIYNWEQMG